MERLGTPSVILIGMLVALSSCASNEYEHMEYEYIDYRRPSVAPEIQSKPGIFQQNYKNMSPMTFVPVTDVKILSYENLQESYDTFFPDFFIMGKSAFKGSEAFCFENPDRNDAKKKGADIVICSARLVDSKSNTRTETKTTTRSISTSSTTYAKNEWGLNVPIGTTYGTQAVPETYTETYTEVSNTYLNEAWYLKNLKNVTPIYLQTKADYKCDGNTKYSGIWKNNDFSIEVFNSAGRTAGFINSSKNTMWQKDDLKFIFSGDTGKGIYIENNRIPCIAVMSINKFGFLEIKVGENTYSFMKE